MLLKKNQDEVATWGISFNNHPQTLMGRGQLDNYLHGQLRAQTTMIELCSCVAKELGLYSCLGSSLKGFTLMGMG